MQELWWAHRVYSVRDLSKLSGKHRLVGCALAACGFLSLLGVPAPAGAAPFTWSGEAAKGLPGWSEAANWQDALAPLLQGPVALSFPRLDGPGCTGESPSDTCYRSRNDMSGIAVESLVLDDGDEYELEGEEIRLGAGGLTATPAASSSGADDDVLGLPVDLAASQTWDVSGRQGGTTGKNGLLAEDGLTGEGDPLTVDLANGALFFTEHETEIGALDIQQAGTGAEGAVEFSGDVNTRDGQPVSVSHVLLAGQGATGPLSAVSAQIVPAPRIEASSVTLDSQSDAVFRLAGVPSLVEHAELVSSGAVDLGGAKLIVEAIPANTPHGTCPELTEGETFTLLSTTGALSGSFANAQEGYEIPIAFKGGCAGFWSLRIAYHQDGATTTVTGTAKFGAPAEPPVINKVEPVVIYVTPFKPVAYIEPTPSGNAKSSGTPSTSRVLLLTNKLGLKRSAAHAEIRCDGLVRCAGTMLLTTSAHSKHGDVSTVKIGSAAFSLRGGATTTVAIKLDAHALTRLRSHHWLNARLAIMSTTSTPLVEPTIKVRLAS
jgi:hypothetical protein